ncbi:hypothetical protein JOB18_022332 [Solea senegalensis]|uniref:TRAF3-interacting protein 1 C-terminal domain-containing protein n=1 Tax=Solea senegalensis TaxID=28829 RepID=A0AAV6QX40_SOLSE|nr:hypothetical protein JOB18_022332 [Solea senegalensis]
MRAEWLTWQEEAQELAQALVEEQKATELPLSPLWAELLKLERQMTDEQDKICAVRGNILKNEMRVQKMVTGISSSPKT